MLRNCCARPASTSRPTFGQPFRPRPGCERRGMCEDASRVSQSVGPATEARRAAGRSEWPCLAIISAAVLDPERAARILPTAGHGAARVQGSLRGWCTRWRRLDEAGPDRQCRQWREAGLRGLTTASQVVPQNGKALSELHRQTPSAMADCQLLAAVAPPAFRDGATAWRSMRWPRV